jgi:hypothetical protein
MVLHASIIVSTWCLLILEVVEETRKSGALHVPGLVFLACLRTPLSVGAVAEVGLVSTLTSEIWTALCRNGCDLLTAGMQLRQGKVKVD